MPGVEPKILIWSQASVSCIIGVKIRGIVLWTKRCGVLESIAGSIIQNRCQISVGIEVEDVRIGVVRSELRRIIGQD